MTAHFWLFPWIALAAGLAAFGLAWVGAKGAAPPEGASLRLPRPLLIAWLVIGALALLGSLRLGATAGQEFLAARGLLLGLLGGLALVALARRSAPPDALPPLVLGLGTALVAAGRLWLTHGEMTGLTSLALGAGLSALCLGVAPALLASSSAARENRAASVSALAVLYVLSLAGAVALGFTRADALNDSFWADIPLLLGAGLSLGAAVGAGLARRTPPINPLLAALPTLLAGLIVILPLSRLAHSWRPLELLGMGILFFGLLARLSARPAFGDTLGSLIGLVMVVSGCTLAFAFWSGYGAGLFILGGWFAAGPAFLSGRADDAPETSANGLAASGFGFAALFLLHRLATLQNNPAVHASGPGDTWDLLAISLGALLPLVAAEWARSDGRALPSWAVVGQWVLTLALPALILDYVWQPRSVSGVLLGAALGQLLSGLAGGDALARRFPAVALSGAVLGLVLFQFLPVLGHIDLPTRSVRIALVLGGAGLLVLRLLVPVRALPGPVVPDSAVR